MNTLVLIGLALVAAGLVLLAVRLAPRVRRPFAASADQPRTVADLVRIREEAGGTPKPPAGTTPGRAAPAPARSAPARSAPARSAPARSAPARSAPARSAPAAAPGAPAGVAAPGVPASGVPASAAPSRVAVAARPAGGAPAAARPAPPAPDPVDPPPQPFESPAPRPAPGRLRREEPADPPPVVLDGGDAPWQRGARMAAGLGGGQPWREPPPPPVVPLRIIRSTERAPLHPAAPAPAHVAEPVAQPPVRLVPDEPEDSPAVAAQAPSGAADGGDRPPPAPARPAEAAQPVIELAERAARRGSEQAERPPEVSEVAVEPAPPAPEASPARALRAEPTAVASATAEAREPERQAAAGSVAPEGGERVEPEPPAPEAAPARAAEAEPTAEAGMPNGWEARRQVAVGPVPAGREPAASGTPDAAGSEPRAVSGSPVREGLGPVSVARTVGADPAASRTPDAPEPGPRTPAGSAVAEGREPVGSRPVALADGTRDAASGQIPLPGGWDDVEAEDVPAGAVPDRFVDEPTASPEAPDEETGRRRSRQTADELAVEQAAVDLALLRTFGFADPGLRPDTAPVVAMERPEEQGAPAAAGDVQPVRYRVVRRDGSVVGGATVTLLDDRGGDVAAGTADTEGRGEIPAPGPGGYVLVSTAAGHQPGAVAITVAGSATEADVLLARSASVSGSVRGEDGPIGGARVTLVQDGEAVDAVDTDADGAYRISDIGAGEYGLSVAAAGCEPVAALLDVAEEAEVRHDVELRSASPTADSDLVDDAISGLR